MELAGGAERQRRAARPSTGLTAILLVFPGRSELLVLSTFCSGCQAPSASSPASCQGGWLSWAGDRGRGLGGVRAAPPDTLPLGWCLCQAGVHAGSNRKATRTGDDCVGCCVGLAASAQSVPEVDTWEGGGHLLHTCKLAGPGGHVPSAPGGQGTSGLPTRRSGSRLDPAWPGSLTAGADPPHRHPGSPLRPQGSLCPKHI